MWLLQVLSVSLGFLSLRPSSLQHSRDAAGRLQNLGDIQKLAYDYRIDWHPVIFCWEKTTLFHYKSIQKYWFVEDLEGKLAAYKSIVILLLPFSKPYQKFCDLQKMAIKFNFLGENFVNLLHLLKSQLKNVLCIILRLSVLKNSLNWHEIFSFHKYAKKTNK